MSQKFESIKPLDLVCFTIANHDAGWREFDREPAVDQSTKMPFNLVDTPPEHITRTSRLSPDFNERIHPYCGLLSSMHSWGLYNGRYGLSDLVLLDRVAEKDRPVTEAMLKHELQRQTKLRDALAADPTTAELLNEKRIMQNYKQLQFIDTLALYFNRIHPEARTTQTFAHVPLNENEDTTVTIRPVSKGVYELTPFPLSSKSSEFGYAGKWLEPNSASQGTNWKSELQMAPTKWETFSLIPG